jgi:phosphoglycolate phosphatase
MRYRCVLFDLDGTLLDTAPDLASALNAVRAGEGLPSMPFEQIRPYVSNGARALILLGFGGDDRDPQFEVRRRRLLDNYRDNLCVHTRLFDGMAEVLDGIEAAGASWGVVTNKPGWLTDPLMAQSGLAARAACIVSGDTLPQRKPHPAPLLHAAAQAGIPPTDCVYVGDARRDATAAHAAGMAMLAAGYGYIEPDEDPQSWGADAVVREPAELLRHLCEQWR